MTQNYIFALDFDGVICDSARETAASGWMAGQQLWPGVFRGTLSQLLVDDFCAVRPVLKTGYESLILLRLLIEGSSVSDILCDYITLKKQFLTRIGCTTDRLQECFGDVRDHWIQSDFQSWLAANRFYPGTVEALKACSTPRYIVTTKQKRFATALCDYAEIAIEASNVFGLESGAKSETLAEISRTHPVCTVVFVEDKLQSIVDYDVVMLDSVRCIFAKWGYNTADDRDMAEKTRHVTSIDLSEFSRLLQDPENFLS